MRISVAVCLMLFAGMAQAQDPPGLPSSLCDMPSVLAGWSTNGAKVPAVNLPVRVREEVAAQAAGLERLCGQMSVLTKKDAIGRTLWLVKADGIGNRLIIALADALGAPQTMASRKHLQMLAVHTAQVQGALNELRDLHSYQHVEVREVPKEVVRTVEVAARCPEPERPQQSPCEAALRQGASRWSGQLYKWTGWYQGSGDDYTLAVSSKSEMANLSSGQGDPVSYVVGWLAQWRNIQRRHDTSFLGSGPMPQIAADMRAQLGLCGLPQPDWDRER